MVEIRNVEFVQQTVEFLSTFTRNPVREIRIVTRDVTGIIRSYSLLVFQFIKDSENRTLLRFQHDFECSKDNPVRVDLFVVLDTGRVLKLCTFSLCQQTVFTDDFIHVIHIPSDLQFAVSVTSNQSSSTQPTSQINISTSVTPEPNTVPISDTTGKIHKDWIPQGHNSGLNADKLDDYHASQNPSPNTVVVSKNDGKIDKNWLPVVDEAFQALDSDKVDGYHASQTPSPNTIPVSKNDGKLDTSWIPTNITVDNSDKVDNFHASQTPSPNTVVVSRNTGKIDLNWIPQGSGSNLDADKLDGYHASQTPTPNTIPVANSSGKLDPGWLPPMVVSGGSSSSTSETYSRLSVGTIEPLTPNHNDLFYNTTLNTLRRYDSRINSWIEIDWQNIIKASPEFIAGRLRVNSTTGKLEISPNGTNWYECIPAVGSQVIELATVDSTTFSYKYWIAPGQTVIVRNTNHLPIISIPQNVFDVRIRISSSSSVNAYLLWIGNVSGTTYYAEINRTDFGANSYIVTYTGHRIGWGGSNGLFTSFSQFSIVFNNNTVESTGSYKYYDSTYGLITFSAHSTYSSSIHWLGTVRRESGGNVLHNFEIATVTRRS